MFDNNAQVDVFGLDCKKYEKIVEGKNFRSHFTSHKNLIEELTGNKYPKMKTHKQTFLDDIQKSINEGTLEYVGQGTLKKDQPTVSVSKSDKITVVVKDLDNNTGEWVTAIRRGAGLDLAIMYKE